MLRRWEVKPGKKGKGFVQPLLPQAHWHIDVSYLNLSGIFYYLCSILDGYSRYIVLSESSWLEVIEQLENQGLKVPPYLAIDDVALGFLERRCQKMAGDPDPTLLGP